MWLLSHLRRISLGPIALAAIGIGIGTSGGLIGSPDPNWPIEAASFTLTRSPHSKTIALAFRYPNSEPRTITLITGGKQAVISMENSVRRLAVLLPPDDAGLVVVQVDPAASVIVSRLSNTPVRTVVWRPTRDETLHPNQPAKNGHPAQASVNEADMLGVRTFGIPIRSGPRVSDRQVAMASHGDRFDATCWTIGDTVTTDLQPRPMDLPIYTSNIWFRVTLPNTSTGYISDVRFSRTGKNGKLGLNEC